MQKKTIAIINKLGLHARAAAQFVQTASLFESNIDVSVRGKTINGKSIMGLMMLAAAKGANMELTINGSDEEDAMAALAQLVAARFGEEE